LFGTDILDNKQNRYLPASTAEGLALGGDAIVGSVFTTNWLNENTLNYEKELGEKSKLSALAGFTVQQSGTEGVVSEAAGFANDALGYNNLGTGITNRTPASFNSQWALASYLGRVNYSYADRYLLTLTLRADGSSRFGKGNKWGYFPSAAVGWNINNEAFFPQQSSVTNLKLRASAGLTGNQSIPPYQSLAQLGYFRYNFSNSSVSGYSPLTVANPDLGWEKTFQGDAGLDVGLLNNRVDVVADVYYKKTTDLLLSRTVPGTSGLSDFYNGQGSAVYQNVGSVLNKGLELSVNSHNLTGDFKWNTIAVYSKNVNEVLSLGAGVKEIIPNNSQPSIAKVGYPLGSFIVYQTDGIIQNGENALTPQANKSPGGQKYKDVNGDGIITQADRIVVSNQPDFSYGLTNTFSYKGFDLAVFFQGTQGGTLYNANRASLELATGYTNGSANLVDRWTPTNTNTGVKAAFQDPAVTISDRFIEDASYLRLRNLTLGYTLPTTWLNPLHVKSLRLYVSAQNLLTWTRYTGFDPEASLNGQSLINKGVDSGVYPNSKTFLGGLAISL
jgi:TonB-linked SusC/RagA family outer membrane protein